MVPIKLCDPKSLFSEVTEAFLCGLALLPWSCALEL